MNGRQHGAVHYLASLSLYYYSLGPFYHSSATAPPFPFQFSLAPFLFLALSLSLSLSPSFSLSPSLSFLLLPLSFSLSFSHTHHRTLPRTILCSELIFVPLSLSFLFSCSFSVSPSSLLSILISLVSLPTSNIPFVSKGDQVYGALTRPCNLLLRLYQIIHIHVYVYVPRTC